MSKTKPCKCAGVPPCPICKGTGTVRAGMSAKYPGTADFSEDGVYRWKLTRRIRPEMDDDRPLVDIGLNPSTASGGDDDNTIRKGCEYALRWGCTSFHKLNAYGYRSTDPKAMFRAKLNGVDIVGPENVATILMTLGRARQSTGGCIILLSWGTNIEPVWQTWLAGKIGPGVVCVRANADGTPMHYLYAKNDVKLVPWVCPVLA